MGKSHVYTIDLFLESITVLSHELVKRTNFLLGKFFLGFFHIFFKFKNTPKDVNKMFIRHIQMEYITSIGTDLECIHPDLLFHSTSRWFVREYFITELRSHIKCIGFVPDGKCKFLICGRMIPYVSHTLYSN